MNDRGSFEMRRIPIAILIGLTLFATNTYASKTRLMDCPDVRVDCFANINRTNQKHAGYLFNGNTIGLCGTGFLKMHCVPCSYTQDQLNDLCTHTYPDVCAGGICTADY